VNEFLTSNFFEKDLRNQQIVKSKDKRTYKVEEIAAILGIGRTTAYKLVKEGDFKTVRIGSAIRISKKSFDEWLDSLNQT